jgi:hypothetical protein
MHAPVMYTFVPLLVTDDGSPGRERQHRGQQEVGDSGEDSDAEERRKFWVGSDCVQRVGTTCTCV